MPKFQKKFFRNGEKIFKMGTLNPCAEKIKTEKPQKKMVEPNNFNSVTNNNCSRLQELLQAGKWEESDNETLAIILRATNRKQEGWFDLEHLQQFPDSELNIINQLWVNYSNGHFGFSVQKTFWPYRNHFFWSVGWFEVATVDFGSQGRIHLQKIFDMTAPKGHLPRCILTNSIKRNNLNDYCRDQNLPDDYRQWWWGPQGSMSLWGQLQGQKRAKAYSFSSRTEEHCRKDLEYIFSRQYLE
jgi:hypothetical protein